MSRIFLVFGHTLSIHSQRCLSTPKDIRNPLTILSCTFSNSISGLTTKEYFDYLCQSTSEFDRSYLFECFQDPLNINAAGKILNKIILELVCPVGWSDGCPLGWLHYLCMHYSTETFASLGYICLFFLHHVMGKSYLLVFFPDSNISSSFFPYYRSMVKIALQ